MPSTFLFSIVMFSFFNLIIPTLSVFNPVTKPIISFCVGAHFSCAVFDNNQMKCWGHQNSIGTTTSYGDTMQSVGDNIPYFNPGTSLFINKVACLYSSLCVLLNNLTIKCVGDNAKGQVGIGTLVSTIGEISGHIGDSLPSVNFGNNVNALDAVGGSYHVCTLVTGNLVKCHGYNNFGQLGLGDTTNRGPSLSLMGDKLPSINFGQGNVVVSIHSGSSANHNCVVFSNPTIYAKRVKCWGYNQFAQLGYGDYDNRGDKAAEMGDSLPFLNLGIESRVKQLALGRYHTCMLLVNDILKCWGYGSDGELGSGSALDISATGNSLPSVSIDSGAKIKILSTGMYHTCIVYDDMVSMKCIGDNSNGQLGQGDTTNRGATLGTMIPKIPVIQLGTGLLKILSIHSGMGHNCIVFTDSSVKCFGYNGVGQLGIGSTGFIGDQSGEMGMNLKYAEIFSPTPSPSLEWLCEYKTAKKCKKDSNCIWKKVNGKKTCLAKTL